MPLLGKPLIIAGGVLVTSAVLAKIENANKNKTLKKADLAEVYHPDIIWLLDPLLSKKVSEPTMIKIERSLMKLEKDTMINELLGGVPNEGYLCPSYRSLYKLSSSQH